MVLLWPELRNTQDQRLSGLSEGGLADDGLHRAGRVDNCRRGEMSVLTTRTPDPVDMRLSPGRVGHDGCDGGASPFVEVKQRMPIQLLA